jgi:hypothetical protein
MSTTDPPADERRIPTSANLIELSVGGRNETPLYLVVHITHLKDRSILVWCGEAGAKAAEIVAKRDAKENDDVVPASKQETKSGSVVGSSHLVEEHHPTMQSGTAPTESEATPITGLLTRDWSVAMSSRNPNVSADCPNIHRFVLTFLASSQHQDAIATSLFRSTLDLSKPMAARLAKRFQLGQIFLSLHVPDQIAAMLEGPYTDPIGQKALLEIEGGIGKCVQESFTRHASALASD